MIYTETAKAMFRAYCGSARTQPIPTWDLLSDEVRRHWLAAAAAARKHAESGGAP